MTKPANSWKLTATRESVLFLWLLAAGLFLLPIAVYVVGRALFGEYGGTGFSAVSGPAAADWRRGGACPPCRGHSHALARIGAVSDHGLQLGGVQIQFPIEVGIRVAV